MFETKVMDWEGRLRQFHEAVDALAGRMVSVSNGQLDMEKAKPAALAVVVGLVDRLARDLVPMGLRQAHIDWIMGTGIPAKGVRDSLLLAAGVEKQ